MALRSLSFALVTSCALLVSCAASPRYARRLDDPQATTSKVVVSSGRLYHSVRAAAVRVERNDDNVLECEVHILNESTQPLPITCHVVFRDHTGTEIERRDEPRAVIGPGQRHILTTTARSVLAQDFTVEVREAHP